MRNITHTTFYAGNVEVTELLVKAKTNLNIRDNEGKTPADYATQSRNRQKFIEVMKKNGKKVKFDTVEDDTDVLLEAVEQGKTAQDKLIFEVNVFRSD